MELKTEAEMKPSGWLWRVRSLYCLEVCVIINNTHTSGRAEWVHLLACVQLNVVL